MPIPCRYCGALLDSYSDFCGCPESEEEKAAGPVVRDVTASEPVAERDKAPAARATPLPRLWPEVSGLRTGRIRLADRDEVFALCF